MSTLSFWSRAAFEPSWDKGEVQISTDGGSSWSRVEVGYLGTSTHTADDCDLGTGQFFTGLGGSGWNEYTADLLSQADQTAMLRWELSTDSSINETGWWVDDIQVFVAGACESAAAGPPSAPDGSASTTPLRGENLTDGTGDTLEVTWDASCSATGYNLIYGDLGNVATYALSGSACGIGTSGAYTWAGVPAGDLYFLVVGTDGAGVESSWGFSSGGERNGLTDSAQCGVTLKNPSGTCP